MENAIINLILLAIGFYLILGIGHLNNKIDKIKKDLEKILGER